MNKICGKCRESKSLNEFHKKGIRYHNSCKSCRKEESKIYYWDFLKDRRKENNKQIKKYKHILREKARQWLYEYLSDKKCIDCPENDPVVLDFDHVKGQKKMLVSQMILSGYSLKTIQKEIEKCDIRCANCHRRKTAKEQGQYKYRKSLRKVTNGK